MSKTKRGRPTFEEGVSKDKVLQIRLSDAELAKYHTAAERAGVALSAWIRTKLDNAAKREGKKA